MPELFCIVSGSLRAMRETMAGLEIDPKRMRTNIYATHGLIFAEAVAMKLAEKIGLPAAHKLLEAASRRAISEGRTLRDVLAEDPALCAHIEPAELDRLFVPESYLGMADAFVSRAVTEAAT